MSKFIIIRIVEGIATVVASSFLVFAALFLAPGDPIAILIGNRTVSAETIAALRAQYHLDQPFLVRWLGWFGDVATGHLGQSMTHHDLVWNLIAPRLSTTGLLLGLSLIAILVFGVGLGTVAALGGRRTGDLLLMLTSLGVAVPTFVASSVLLTVFAVNIGWFPTYGAGTSFIDRIYHLILPVTALALAAASYVLRVTRSALREESQKEQVQTAVGRGLPRRHIISHHITRNALSPIATVVGVTLTSIIVGSIVVEKAFALDGIGSLLTDAVLHRDFAVVQGITLLLIVFVVAVTLVVDIVHVTFDPRVRARVVAP